MIEMAPEEYYQDLNFNDATLYCFSLNIDSKQGWRLPTYAEMLEIHRIYGYYSNILPCWHQTSPWLLLDIEIQTVPVRTVEKTIKNRIRCMFHPRYLNV